MDNVTTRRPIAALVNLTAASVVAVTVTATVVAPVPMQSTAVPHIAAQSVELAALPEPLQSLWDLASGADPAYPLPTPSNPIAPVAEQFVRNLASYGGELLAGQGAQIPGQISARINKVGSVLLSIPSYLQNVVAPIPTAIGGGVILGLFAGAGVAVWIVQHLFPSSDPGPLGAVVVAVVVPITVVTGAVVGAAAGLAAVPIVGIANALGFRNSLAMALATPGPQQAAASQPAAAAAVTPTDPASGDTGVERGVGTLPKHPAVAEALTAGKSADNGSALRDATIESTPVATEPESASSLAEPSSDETVPAPDPTSTVTSSPVSDKAVTRQQKISDRPASATRSATHAKSGHGGPGQSRQKAAPKSAD